MQRRFHFVLVSLLVLGVVGCSNNSASNSKLKTDASASQPKPPPPPPPPPPPSSPTEVSGSATSERPATTPQPAVQPATPAAAASPPPMAVAQRPIQLATGVALAQTGPEGTMMMFSVDYEVGQGEPSTSGYIWVIERAHGNAGKVEVKLTPKGTLRAGMTVKWKPEDGPFYSHLEDRKGNRMSESIEMLQPGT